MRSPRHMAPRHWWHRVLATTLAVGGALGFLAAAAPAAQSAVPSHSQAGQLIVVSCASQTWCMATGKYVNAKGNHHPLAEVWNGTSWRLVAGPPAPTPWALSCPSPHFCMAAGGPTKGEIWTGRSWRKLTASAQTSGDLGVGFVSCANRDLCVSISSSFVMSWNGKTWHTWQQETNACNQGVLGLCGMLSVACGHSRTARSATCVAVGTTSGNPATVVTAGVYWNGDGWTRVSPPADGLLSSMFDVGCAPGFCMTAGGTYQSKDDGSVAVADAWDAATKSWQDDSPDLGVICHGTGPCSWSGSLFCGNPANCLARVAHGMLAWNGSAWIGATPLPGGGTTLAADGFSCGGPVCVTVGSLPGAEGLVPAAQLWNGTQWSFLPAPKLP